MIMASINLPSSSLYITPASLESIPFTQSLEEPYHCIAQNTELASFGCQNTYFSCLQDSSSIVQHKESKQMATIWPTSITNAFSKCHLSHELPSHSMDLCLESFDGVETFINNMNSSANSIAEESQWDSYLWPSIPETRDSSARFLTLARLGGSLQALVHPSSPVKNMKQEPLHSLHGWNGTDPLTHGIKPELGRHDNPCNPTKKRKTTKGFSQKLENTCLAGEGKESTESSKSLKSDGSATSSEKKLNMKAGKKSEASKQDYIHVRARRGQATDSHSLAERVRREKISERMKLLQSLVPNCSKVAGKAMILDEIINYVQLLRHQVEFLSMKLSALNPAPDYLNVENLYIPCEVISTHVAAPAASVTIPLPEISNLRQRCFQDRPIDVQDHVATEWRRSSSHL